MPEHDASYFFHRFDQAYRDASDPKAGQGFLMRSIADAISEHGAIPPAIQATFDALRSAWTTDDPDVSALKAAKGALWAAIEAKNGNSTTTADVTDRTLRAILCLADPVGPDDATDTAGWAAEMLSSEEWPRQTIYF